MIEINTNLSRFSLQVAFDNTSALTVGDDLKREVRTLIKPSSNLTVISSRNERVHTDLRAVGTVVKEVGVCSRRI
jgi:hypothetical protein